MTEEAALGAIRLSHRVLTTLLGDWDGEERLLSKPNMTLGELLVVNGLLEYAINQLRVQAEAEVRAMVEAEVEEARC